MSRTNFTRWLILTILVQLSCSTQTEKEGAARPRETPPTLSRTDVEAEDLVVRKTVYVPIYSQIYVGSARRTFELTATLSLRNTDRHEPIVVQSVTYFDSGGSALREYLEGPSLLGPMATADFVIERTDTTGGSGANFLVEWGAEQPVTEPHVEAVMIGQAGTAGISFVTQGRVLESSSRSEATSE